MAKNVIAYKNVQNAGPLGFIGFMAYIGAAVYFINQASGFWAVIWALIKAIVWPAILLYHGFQALHV